MIVRYMLMSISVAVGLIICSIAYAKRSAGEAGHANQEVTRLHTLATDLLEQRLGLRCVSLPHLIMQIFDLKYCAIYLPSGNCRWHRFSGSPEDSFTTELVDMKALIEEYEGGVQYQVVKAEKKTIAIIALKPGDLSPRTIATIANMLALSIEGSPYKHEFAER